MNVDVCVRENIVSVKYFSGSSYSSVMGWGVSFFSEFKTNISVPYSISPGKQNPFGVQISEFSGTRTFILIVNDAQT